MAISVLGSSSATRILVCGFSPWSGIAREVGQSIPSVLSDPRHPKMLHPEMPYPKIQHGTSYSMLLARYIVLRGPSALSLVRAHQVILIMPGLKTHVRAYLIGDTQSTRCSKHDLSYILIKSVRAMLSTLIKSNKTGRARFTSPQDRQPHPSLSPHLRGLLSLLDLLADSKGRQRYSTNPVKLVRAKLSTLYINHMKIL